MSEQELLAGQFEQHRAHLRAVATRMLGTQDEADDAIQEAWLRVSRADTHDIDNLGGWLTTVLARVCLDMLRSRDSRREEPLAADESERPLERRGARSAEDDAVLADSVGMAMHVVLERLPPAERVAFVLHDMFDLTFDEIGPIVGRSAVATRAGACAERRNRRRQIAIGIGRSPRRSWPLRATPTSRDCSPCSIRMSCSALMPRR